MGIIKVWKPRRLPQPILTHKARYYPRPGEPYCCNRRLTSLF
nr:MAG TPA: hypothetical protein [Caudoviricetes sp.]